jgi:hypothetical protein
MSKRTDIELLIDLPQTEYEQRMRAAAERVELRMNRAITEGRDLTSRENELTRSDR